MRKHFEGAGHSPILGESALADAWLPGATRINTEKEAEGDLKGGAPRAVWHTTETDPRLVSARSAAHALQGTGHSAHLIWNPLTGEIVQMAPATRAARPLPGDAVREGRVCIHIVVVASARQPFTDGPLRGIDGIMAWLDSWRVPRRWPSGPPLPSPQDHLSPRSRRAWARGGHYGASQLPESDHAGPGGIDVTKLTGGPAVTHDGIALPQVGAPVRDQRGGHGGLGEQGEFAEPGRIATADRQARPNGDRGDRDLVVVTEGPARDRGSWT